MAESATPNIGQVCEAIGAPDAAKTFAKFIRAWSAIYSARPEEIVLQLIDGIHQRNRRSLRMGKQVPEDWASLMWTENARIEAGGEAEQEALDRHFGEDFAERLAADIEVSFALGTGAIEILPTDLTVSGSGELLVGQSGRLELVYVPAECIVPLSWTRTGITEVAFVSWGKGYVDVREHRCDGRLRTITNRRFECQSDNKLGKLQEIDLPEGMLNSITLEDAEPMFAILAPALANNLVPGSPFGVSIFDSATDAIDAADIAFDNFIEDIRLGGKMVFIPDTMLKKDPTTKKFVAPQSTLQNLFVALPDATGESNQKIHEHNPDLRVGDNKAAVEMALQLVASKSGLGDGYYHFTGSGVSKTATEVVSESSDLYRNRKKHLNKLTASLTGLARSVLWAAAAFLGESVNPDVEISVTVDDSVIEDDAARQARGMAKVAAGLLSELTYLVQYEGYTEEDAKKELALIASSRAARPLFSA